MKIPGLDEITANMNKFADMLPVLESINNNLRVLAEVQIKVSTMTGPDKKEFLERLS